MSRWIRIGEPGRNWCSTAASPRATISATVNGLPAAAALVRRKEVKLFVAWATCSCRMAAERWRLASRACATATPSPATSERAATVPSATGSRRRRMKRAARYGQVAWRATTGSLSR